MLIQINFYYKLFLLNIFILIGFIPLVCLSEMEIIHLKNNSVELSVTPNVGGRVLHFSAPGMPNILSIGNNVLTKPAAEISENSQFVSYLGHINWLSPQSKWWVNQNLNLERKNNQSFWPPDPYLIFSKNKIVEKNKQLLILEGVNSPLTGVRFKKTFSLTDIPGTVDLNVEAKNISNKNVSWGIWFNTRVNPHATVYVPIKNKDSVHFNHYDQKENLPVKFLLEDNFLSFEHYELKNKKQTIRGKAFIKPSKGWMVAFVKQQAFIIQFPLKNNAEVHHEHGQIEIYHEYKPGDSKGGDLEMELHSPYLKIKPNESIKAKERWRILPYLGKNSRKAHLHFLTNLPDMLEKEQ